MFSAYDLKKIIPRAIFALVIANLSWSLMSVMIDASNFLGDSAQALVLAPFANTDLLGLSLSSSSSGAFGAIAIVGGGAAALGLIPILGVAVAGLLGLMFAFGIILLRRVALVGLVIIAPIAIALSVFPQTEKWAKQWWEWFLKLLLMYPFIMAFFGLSEVAAGIISRQGGSTAVQIVYDLSALAILIMPYFIVGKAFSLAGGAMGKLAGMVNNKDRGLLDKTKKWEAGKVAEHRTDAKGGSRYGGKNFVTRGINRTLRDGANVHKTAFRGQAKRDAEILAANERTAAALEEIRPGVKSATKDELKIGMLSPNEAAAKAAIERMVAEAPAEEQAATRAKWEAALIGWKSKAGSLDSASATYALKKGAELGLATPGEIGAATATIGKNLGMRGILTEDGEKGRVGAALDAGLEPAVKASGSVFGFGPTAKNAVEFAGLAPTEQAALTGAVDGMFTGEKAMSYQSLGKVNAESAATVRTAKAQQVQSIMGDLANGVITPAQAEAQLAEHRQHALLLSHAIANSDSKDAVAAGEAASLVDDIDAAMAAAPVPLNSAAVVDQSLAGARARAKPL